MVKDFQELILDRAKRDPKFRAAVLKELEKKQVTTAAEIITILRLKRKIKQLDK